MTDSSKLTPYEKKQYFLNKYVKRDYNAEDIEECKKYVVYFNPSIEKIKEWEMVCVCSSLQEAKQQIAWRMHYMKTNDGDIVLDNDKRFNTWRDETKNVNEKGLVYEPTDKDMSHNYNSTGNMLQVIANSAPQVPNTNGFRGIAYYSAIEIGNYNGFYEIKEVYSI